MLQKRQSPAELPRRVERISEGPGMQPLAPRLVCDGNLGHDDEKRADRSERLMNPKPICHWGFMLRFYATALRVAASRNHAALSFGVRFWVLKSTCTRPKRSPYPLIHSKLSIALH